MILEAIERLNRRIFMLLGRGRLTTANDAGAVQMLQVQLGADEVRDNTPRLAEYGFTSNPPRGTDCLVVFLRGERSSGVVVGTNNQAARKKGLAVGEVAIHDDQGQLVYITRNGIVINGAGKPVTITNAPTITLDAAQTTCTGNLTVQDSLTVDQNLTVDGNSTVQGASTVDGDLNVVGEITDQNGTKGNVQHIRDQYDAHIHYNLAGGAISGPSNSL